MGSTNYRYELRRGNEIVATGHLTWDHDLHLGEEITIGPNRGIVQTFEPLLATTKPA